MRTRTDQQLSIHLLKHALSEISSARFVDRNDDHAPQRTTKERHHPFRRVRAPQQDALTFADAALFQFARKTVRGLGHLPVAPAFSAVSAMLDVGALPLPSQKARKVFDNGAA